MKKLIFTLAALLIAHLASAEMLYWMIGDATNGGENTIEFNYAVLYAAKGSETIEVRNSAHEAIGGSGLQTAKITTELSVVPDYQSYSFYVELFNYDISLGEMSVGISERTSYAALVSHGAIIPSGMAIPPTAHVWMPTTVVPEPSGGLLLLFGFAFLALKRKS